MTAKIAIVGAGPAGCYLAQALLKLDKALQVDIIDRLPVPYGLIRYGVAPDHQGTKGITRQFARLFERQGVGFIGNISVGRDLDLDRLRDLYDAVALTTGLATDRKLGVPGETLPGVIGAGALTRHWNDHPDAVPLAPKGRVVLIGNGNVAMDVLRLLSKAEDEFDGSDFCPTQAQALAGAGIAAIDVVGRSPAHLAKFDPVMVKELGKSSSLSFSVKDLEESFEAADDPRLAALAQLRNFAADRARCNITFHFGWTPEAFEGADRLSAARFRRADGQRLELSCTTAVTAIGFDDTGILDRAALLSGATDDGRLAPGLYAAGWFRRGPRGTIPENRADAQAVAQAIHADLAAGSGEEKPGSAGLHELCPDATDFTGWMRIDAAETAAAGPGRVRRKIRDRAEMLTLARQTED